MDVADDGDIVRCDCDGGVPKASPAATIASAPTVRADGAGAWPAGMNRPVKAVRKPVRQRAWPTSRRPRRAVHPIERAALD